MVGKNRGMHGITTETHKNLMLDAGLVVLNYGLGVDKGERELGATMGGNTFTVERDIRVIEPDGNKGKTKELRRVINENATLSTNLFEITKENIMAAIAGSVAKETPAQGTEGTADYVPAKTYITSGDILTDSYIANVTLLATISGLDTPVEIKLLNVLSDENFELGMEDKNEATLAATFSAHWEMTDENIVPWSIYYPDTDETETGGTTTGGN